MKQVLHNLRQRPQHERKALAAGAAITTTGVLFVGWFVFFVSNLQADSTTYAVQPAPAANVAAVQNAQQQPVQQQTVATTTEQLNIPAGGYLTGEPTTTIDDPTVSPVSPY